MKLLHILLLVIIPFTCQAQSVQVQLFGKTKCNNQVEVLDHYGLKKEDKTYVAAKGDYLILPDTGTYTLFIAGIYDDSLTIHIRNYGVYTDTIMKASILEYAYIPNWNESNVWLCCDEKCDGYQSDYDKNGVLRVEGTFKKGKPRGAVKCYRSDGSILCIYYYNKRGKLLYIEDFDISGALLM